MGNPNVIIGAFKLPLVFNGRKIYTHFRKPTNEEINSIMPHEFTSPLEYKPKLSLSPHYKKTRKIMHQNTI